MQFGISAGGPSGLPSGELVGTPASPFWSLHIVCLDLFPSDGWSTIAFGQQTVFRPEPDLEGPSIRQTNIREPGRPVAVSLQNMIKATGCSHLVWGYSLSLSVVKCDPHMSCFVCAINKQTEEVISTITYYQCCCSYSPLQKLTNL